jgi:hypothetical protein
MYVNPKYAMIAVTFFSLQIFTPPAHADFDQNGIASYNPGCKAKLKVWKRKGGWKALAISDIYQSEKFLANQTCGWSWQYSSKSKAVNEALKSCRIGSQKDAVGKIPVCKLTKVSR